MHRPVVGSMKTAVTALLLELDDTLYVVPCDVTLMMMIRLMTDQWIHLYPGVFVMCHPGVLYPHTTEDTAYGVPLSSVFPAVGDPSYDVPGSSPPPVHWRYGLWHTIVFSFPANGDPSYDVPGSSPLPVLEDSLYVIPMTSR